MIPLAHAADFIAFVPLGLLVVGLIAFFLWPSRGDEDPVESGQEDDAGQEEASPEFVRPAGS